MKTIKIIFILTLIAHYNSIAQSRKPIKQKPPIAPVIIDENPLTYYTKNYKTQNGQGYLRNVDRFYFGFKNSAAETFKQHDYRKGINVVDYNKFNKASFYGTGIYTMPEDKKEMAIEIFRPIVDSIINEMSTSRTLHAEIIVYGFTDEAPIDESTTNYQEVVNYSKKISLSENEYNNTLSFLRAKDVGDIISMLLSINLEKLKRYDQAIIDVIMEGRGIEYPDYTREYELEDDKRKIVKVYWKVY